MNEYQVEWVEVKTERVLAETAEQALKRVQDRIVNNPWKVVHAKEWNVVEVPYFDDDGARWQAEEEYNDWLVEGKYDR